MSGFLVFCDDKLKIFWFVWPKQTHFKTSPWALGMCDRYFSQSAEVFIDKSKKKIDRLIEWVSVLTASLAALVRRHNIDNTVIVLSSIRNIISTVQI